MGGPSGPTLFDPARCGFAATRAKGVGAEAPPTTALYCLGPDRLLWEGLQARRLSIRRGVGASDPSERRRG
ncbi:DUF6053 domain-containing protein [Lysobacter yananisis]|uniref:DUF6053 domain-containing protein n=1 Tax=Lysobacter yananisis TaxID=1003114 RepID=UPI003CE58635